MIQVNQVGTVTEAIEVVKQAKDAQWGVIISHRSGETEETFIADLAVGLATGQVKAGAPCRGERLAKYNQVGPFLINKKIILTWLISTIKMLTMNTRIGSL